MAQVQNAKLLQEGTGRVTPGESLAEPNGSVSPTYLEGATNASNLNVTTKLPTTINKANTSLRSSPDGATVKHGRKILTARRKLGSNSQQILMTQIKSAIPKSPRHFIKENGCSLALYTVVEEAGSIASITSGSNSATGSMENSDGEMRKDRLQQFHKRQGSIESLNSDSEFGPIDSSESESDEELKKLTAKMPTYKKRDYKCMALTELRQVMHDNVAVMTYIASKCEDVDEQRTLNNLISTIAQCAELLWQRAAEKDQLCIEQLRREKERLRNEGEELRAELAALRIGLTQSKSELAANAFTSSFNNEDLKNSPTVALTGTVEDKYEDMKRSIMVKAKAMINEQFDALEARLPKVQDQEKSQDTAPSLYCRDSQDEASQVAASVAADKREKKGKRKDKQSNVAAPTEDLPTSRGHGAVGNASGSQRCWCAAGQEKRELQIERAIVKAWCSSKPYVKKINLEDGHIPIKACESSFPRLSRLKDYWWTQELDNLHVQKSRARRAYSRSRSRKKDEDTQRELREAYRRAKKNFEKALNLAKERGLERLSST